MGQKSLEHASLADIPEPDLVKLLMGHPHWRGRLLNIYGFPPNAIGYLEVSLRGLPAEPRGDIDILLVAPGRPDFATAISIKRVKVHGPTFASGSPNKLDEQAKARQQANLLAKIGFAQVYYFAFVVVDSRENNADPNSYDGLTPDLQRKIETAIVMDGLDERVGLIHYEFVQSMDDEPLGAGTAGAHLKRGATEGPQPREVTTWVRHIQATHTEQSS